MSLKKIYFNIRYGEPLIIVSGLPRSGTSMIMQMLDAGGQQFVTDKIREADDDNPKGYCELERVKELDKGADKSWLKDYRGTAIKIISFLLHDLPLNLNYKVIFILRNVDEVLISQNKMLIHRGEKDKSVSDEKMKENYEKHLWRVHYLLKNRLNFESIYINYHDVLKSPLEQARMINNFLDYRLDEEAMTGVINPLLYRNRM